jgi:hypothetical protein
MKFLKKIVLGTMKFKKYFNNSNELAIFLDYAHKKGVKQLHVSNEYSSYNLLKKSLKRIDKRKFTFILKLSESDSDYRKFSLKKFEKKILKYFKDLGNRHTYEVQLVNRYKCNNAKEYLYHEQKTFDIIKDTINKLKKEKIIKSFYFFPYHKNKIKIKKHLFIDGMIAYRNLYESQIDNYAKQNNYKIIAMRTFGVNEKQLIKKNLKKLIMFNLKNKLVKKVVVGTNNKFQLDQLIMTC